MSNNINDNIDDILFNKPDSNQTYNSNGLIVNKEPEEKVNDGVNNVPDNTISIFTENPYFYEEYVSNILESLKGKVKRDWFSNHAYYCGPLALANQMGFIVKSQYDFKVKWDGNDAANSVIVEVDFPEDTQDPLQFISSHFGIGTFTVQNRFTFRTPPGVNLMVINPPNMWKDGIHQMTAVIETDNLRRDFTFNLRVTRPDTWIEFKKGEPLGCVIPTPRGFIDGFNYKMAEDTFKPELIKNERTIMTEFGAERSTVDQSKHANNGRRYYRGEDVRDNKYQWGHQPGSSLRDKQYRMKPPAEILEKNHIKCPFGHGDKKKDD